MIKRIRSFIKNPKRVMLIVTAPLRPAVYGPKIFCIGYNKTGTTSFGNAMESFGYKNISFRKRIWRKWYKNNEIVKILRYTAKFDSTDDLPWLREDMIPILDRVFPESKFVYLTRDEESWKNSLYNWTFKVMGEHPNLEEELIRYRSHRDFVLNYFKDRPDDLLVLAIKDSDGMKNLAAFLEITTGESEFPHENKTSS